MSDERDPTTSAVRTVFGTTRRDGHWGLAEDTSIAALLGRAIFDLREATPLEPEETVAVSIRAIFGTVELLVPIGTQVALEGTTFLGGSSSDVTEDASAPPSGLPPIEVDASVFLGRVRIRTPDRPRRPASRRRRRKQAKGHGESLAEVVEVAAAPPRLVETIGPARTDPADPPEAEPAAA